MVETIDGASTADEVLREVRRLYELGRYVQAYRAAAPLGPLAGWTGLEGRILAGQLFMQLGDEPRALRSHLRLHRIHPESQRAWYWVALAVRARFGPWAAMALLRERAEQVEGPGERGAELVALAASTAAMLKDFLTAERLIARAEAMDPASAWVKLERSHVLRAADDWEGALRVAEEAARLRPDYRPSVEARADLLVMLERDDEALGLLGEAMGRFESTGVAWSLFQLQQEREDLAGAEATLDRIEAWTPLKGRGLVAALARRRSDLAWKRGDREATIRLARSSRSPFHEKLAERLEAGRAGPRKVLPVAFVRQNDKTCAPATLTGLARFHGVEVQHLEVAEQICYDGTPDWAQRRWAEALGFVVRDFTVTWEVTRALIDRGLPFALATVDPGSAHLQAVVGYDEGRATLLLRDPSTRSLTELAEPGLETYRASGPHGTVMVPREKAALLDGLALPDAALYDRYHEVQAALVDHRRADADAARRALAAAAPGHRLALHADRAVAGYDGDEEARLAATEALLALFPDDVNLRLSKQASLSSLGRHLARVEYLRAECARGRRSPGAGPRAAGEERATPAHPLLALVLGEAIRLDARALPEVEALARRVLRQLAYDPAAYRLAANVAWERGDREAALHAYRAAACLGWAEEHHADAFFRAARCLGRVEEGLAFLRWREQRLGGRSGQPAMTLHDALETVERTPEALAALAAAVARRPDDGALLLFAARARAAAGELEAARSLVERARTSVHPAQVLRAEATLAGRAGDVATAAARWSALAELDPLDVGAVRAATRSAAALRGEAAAIAELRRRVERFPFHQGLSHVLLEWLRDGAPDAYEAELRRLLVHHPGDAWAWRELAIVLSRRGDAAGALEQLARAEAIDPRAAALHNVRGGVLEAAGRIDEARAELRRALACDADEEWALGRLLELSADVDERRGHLAFALGELRRQVILGDGILGWQSMAQTILAPEEVLRHLREAHALRPDLWHTWVALARQLGHAGALDEAGRILAAAAARFPLLPRIPVEQAALARASGDHDANRKALERAVSLSPGWAEAVTQLATVLQDAGDFAAELAVLDRALRHTPDEAILHGWRADALRCLGRDEEACTALERALHFDPSYAWARETLVELCRRSGAPGRPLALAEAMAAERPHDAAVWVLVARCHREPADRLAPLERALAARPRDVGAWELRVDTLVELKRFDEALAAAAPPAFGGVPPRSLRLRAARIHDARGDREAALAALRSLARQEPDFLEAQQLLADWEEVAGDAAAALAAADALVRLAPHRAVSHGYRGQALLLGGARAEGKAALRHALDLDPSYGWAVEKLLAAELEDGWTEAQAIAELRERVRRCPDHEGLGRKLIVWMRDEPPAEVEAELRRFLGVHPENAWGWRELATVLSRAGRTADALEALARAEAFEPSSPSLHNVRASVLHDAGRIDEAQAALLRSLACDADDDWPLRRLLDLSADADQRRAHLRAAIGELRRQVILGDGLLHLQGLGRGLLPDAELTAELREARRQRPDLWQGAVALARQLVHAGAAEEAAAVLAEAEARFPAVAQIALEQAEVAEVRGDAAARRAALERAVFLAPGWTEAACELAGVLQDAEEYDRELEVLDRALRHAPGQAMLHGWRADALRHAGRRAEALGELERGLRLDPGYRWAWDTLVHLCTQEDQARPGAVAEAIARERPHDSQAWVLVARAAPAPADRLEPLARALRLFPRDAAAAELQASTLLELGRHGEALAACDPPAFGGAVPRSLELLGVKVRDAAGDRASAMKELRALVRREPEYLDAWQLLADWEEAAKDHPAALAAARELVRMAPRRAVSHGYLGHALLLCGDRGAAKAALRRAVELDEGYTWALRRLVDVEIEDGDADAAHDLELVERRVNPGAAAMGRARLALRRGEADAALAALEALAHLEEGWEGAEVSKAFDGAGEGAALDRALETLLGRADVVRAMGRLWAARAADAKRWGASGEVLAARLAAPPPGAAALGAAGAWLERLAEAGRAGDVRILVERFGPALRADVRAWGSAGYALTKVGRHHQCVAWMTGWHAREGLRPWMLLNLAQSLRDLGRIEEATAVNRAALALPRDHCTALHRIHLECDAALAGGPDQLAGEALPESGYHRRLADLAAAVRAARAAPPRAAFRVAWPFWQRAQAKSPADGPFYSRFRRRAVWAVARRGGALAPLWYLRAFLLLGD